MLTQAIFRSHGDDVDDVDAVAVGLSASSLSLIVSSPPQSRMQYLFHVVSCRRIGKETKSKMLERTVALYRRLAKTFPGNEYWLDNGYMLLVRTTRAKLGREMFRFITENNEGEGDVWGEEVVSPMEIAHARYVVLECAPSLVDTNRSFEGFNRYPVVLCRACGWADETVVPSPYEVSAVVLRSPSEIFTANNSLFIVRPRVKELLINLVGEEVDWGEARAGKVGHGKTPFFWIRPKARIGADTCCYVHKSCPTCGVPTQCCLYGPSKGMRNGKFAGILRPQHQVESFGPKKPNIATFGNWVGPRSKTHLNIAREIVLSGGLFAQLYNAGVKGLAFPRSVVFSKRKDLLIEKRRRFANVTADRADRILHRKPSPLPAIGKRQPW